MLCRVDLYSTDQEGLEKLYQAMESAAVRQSIENKTDMCSVINLILNEYEKSTVMSHTPRDYYVGYLEPAEPGHNNMFFAQFDYSGIYTRSQAAEEIACLKQTIQFLLDAIDLDAEILYYLEGFEEPFIVAHAKYCEVNDIYNTYVFDGTNYRAELTEPGEASKIKDTTKVHKELDDALLEYLDKVNDIMENANIPCYLQKIFKAR